MAQIWKNSQEHFAFLLFVCQQVSEKPVLVSAFFCNKDLDCNKEFNKYHDFGAVFVENIWFCTFLICDWFKIFSPLSQPMRIKTRALLAEIA